MAQEKMDRRVRRTKTLLLQGLIQLMDEKDVKDISVKELSDLADINRGTFYLHYSDVYDMLGQIEESLFQEFNDILERDLAINGIGPVISKPVLLDLFIFLDRNRALARALINSPSILLADEPTGNLDPKNSWDIMKLLEEINESGTTVVVVTHNREIVNAMQKRVVTMKKGVIISDEEEGAYIDDED